MIELRWKEVYIPIQQTDDGYGYGRTDKVLQYRVRRFRAALPFNAGFEGWGAWQDVPEFQEQPPAAHDESSKEK